MFHGFYNKIQWLMTFLGLFFAASPARADWTLNLGYHNPVSAHYGLNFLYWGQKWSFEIGLGWIDGRIDNDDDETPKDDEDRDDDDNAKGWAAGDINLKYRFTNGTFAPYIQGGFGTGLAVSAGDDTGAHASFGGPFAGIGLMMGSAKFYVYVADNYLFEAEDTQIQAGLGFDI